MEIIDCDQGTEAWYKARLGLPTASQFSTVLAKAKEGVGASKTRKSYLYKLAGEIITGEPMESYSNGAMQRGKDLEEQARVDYCFMRDVEPKLVGFIKSGRKGCSPDALISSDGALEIKTTNTDLLVKMRDEGRFPTEHFAQTQGILWITQREWIDLAVYPANPAAWPKIKPFIRRAVRDERYIAALSKEIDRFNEELDAIVARVKEDRP